MLASAIDDFEAKAMLIDLAIELQETAAGPIQCPQLRLLAHRSAMTDGPKLPPRHNRPEPDRADAAEGARPRR